MFKTLLLTFAVISSALAFGASRQDKKDDKSVHHSAMHAENWVNHHTSAPHNKKSIRRRKAQVKSVHHAAMHAEHWLDHHVSAPHKTGN